MKNPINTLLEKTDEAIAEETEREIVEGFEAAMDEIADSMVGSPLPIGNPEEKVFGARDRLDGRGSEAYELNSGKTVTTMPSPKSPEDMEKEYISEAERAMKELTEARTENENDITEYKRNIEASTANIVLIDRLFAGHESFLKEALPVSKTKTPKKPEGKL